MAWLTEAQLTAMGFESLGRNVRISDRAAIHSADQIRIGDFSRIDDFCVLSGKVSLGRNVHIAVQCNLAGGTPGIVMEDFSGLAYACQVFSQSDDYSGRTMTNPTVPSAFKSETKKPVLIQRHSIVGAAAVIFPGVTIAEGCAIASQATVAKSTLPWGIYAGQPARRIKDRERDLLELERQYLQQAP